MMHPLNNEMLNRNTNMIQWLLTSTHKPWIIETITHKNIWFIYDVGNEQWSYA
jgi:hypothetical protein